MSSGIQKIKSRLELKAENTWLRTAFRNAIAAFEEQQQNGADLAKGLWAAAKANGGELRIAEEIAAGMPVGAKLHGFIDADTKELVFIAAAADEPEAPTAPTAPDAPPADVPPLDAAAVTDNGEAQATRPFNALLAQMAPERREQNAEATAEMLKASILTAAD